jgi:AraC-like DNA-binding protein
MNHQAITTPPKATGGIARLAIARALEAGIQIDPLLRRAHLTTAEINDTNARIAVAKQIALLECVAGALNDEMLGSHLAESFDLRQVGLLFYVIASAATLGDALARAERYSTINNEGVIVRCVRGGDLGVRFNYFGVPRHADRHQIEFWTVALVRIIRHVTGVNLPLRRVTFVHRGLRASKDLNAALGCAIAYGERQDEITFASSAANLALAHADPYLHELLVGYCEQALSYRDRPPEALRTRVENEIAPLLPHGKARIAVVARALDMSQRTLARRLAAESLTFGEVSTALRADLATRYLSDSTLSVSQVAWLLGFQEVSAFTHAFTRWYGLTPSQFRAARRSNCGSQQKASPSRRRAE